MPEPISEEELERIVDDAIAENGATSLRDMGRVMADVMPQVAGRADGGSASSCARSSLERVRIGAIPPQQIWGTGALGAPSRGAGGPAA